jgi:predicted nucleotidyltransferase
MIFTSDMQELIEIFERLGVEYVLVGGFAVNYYGYVRTTQDVDILLRPSEENAARVMEALAEFGFGQAGIPPECFTREGTAVHLGEEPNRIDLLTRLKGVSIEEVFSNLERVEYQGLNLNIIGLSDLLACKRSSDRPRDLADADELEKTLARKR